VTEDCEPIATAPGPAVEATEDALPIATESGAAAVELTP
jgi:hypothetical protein